MTRPTDGSPMWNRWDEVDSLFSRLLELPPEDREPRLLEWCGGDAELEQTLRDLLLADDGAALLDRPPAAVLVRAAMEHVGAGEELGIEDDETILPVRIGPYRVLRHLGRGGMASVYLARREDPDFPQHVAIKVLRRGLAGEDVARRFRAERRILAILRHPNIARVFDTGTTEDGRLYLVMEYVEGRSLISHCDGRRLDLPTRLRLFMAVTRAVAHAHERGIVHGDLTPSNILVTEEEEHVRLLDFGIARILDGGAGEPGRPAAPRAPRPMTPAFASPEQLRGLPVTERSDVYQLGLILYELLTGRRPFAGAARTRKDSGSRVPLPSLAARQEAAEVRGTNLQELTRTLAGDLDSIVMRAIHPDPQRRYASVRDLHDDLARFLDGGPGDEGKEAASRRGALAARGVAVAVIAAVGALLWAGFNATGDGAPADTSAADRVHWFAVGPISAEAGADTGLAPQVAELLVTNLARVPQVQVVALQRWADVETADGREGLGGAARLAGAHELLAGTLQSDENGLLLELARIDLETGRATNTYQAQAADPFVLVDRITAGLLADLGVAPPARGIAGVTTSSLVAYRLYEEGLRVYYGGDNRAALDLFSAALDADPRFAMAAYRRALINAGIDHTASRNDLLHATRFAGQASPRERLLIRNAWAYEMDDPSQTELADSLVTHFPAEPASHLFMGRALSARGDFMRAVPEFERARSLSMALAGMGDPHCLACDAMDGLVTAYVLADSLAAAEREARGWVALRRESDRAWRSLAKTLEYQGRAEEALTARGLAAALGSGNPRDGVFAAVLALRDGDFETADRRLAAFSPNVDPLLWQNVLWYRTLSARYQGRFAEALAWATQYRETLLAAAAAGHPPLWAPLLEAVVLEDMGRAEEAAAVWRRIASAPYEPESASRNDRHRAWTLTHAAGALAAAGEIHLLDALADTIQALGARSAFGRDPRLHEYVRGLHLAARGDHVAAAEAFRRAIHSLTVGYGRINLELGRALLALGEPEEAIAVLGATLRGPLDSANLYVNRTDIHRLLSQAYSAANLPDSARVHREWVERALSN